MRLLIAGWHGQIARALVELAPARESITGFSIGRPALDLCTASSIRNFLVAEKPDVVINTAAYTEVDRAESEPDVAFAFNSAGAEAFAELAATRGTPIIHLSTAYVFDGAKDGPYTEDDAPGPLSVYGRSKLEGEHAVVDANPHHVILRTSWIYSPFGRSFVKSMLEMAKDRSEIGVVDDQIGCPIYALHVAEAILSIAERLAGDPDASLWGTYHFGGTGAVSWCGFASRIFEVSRALGGPSAAVRPITSDEFGSAAPRLANACLDVTKAHRAFGLSAPEWSSGLEDCVRRLLDDERG